MLEIYPYDAGRGDCLRIRFCDEKGAYRNIWSILGRDVLADLMYRFFRISKGLENLLIYN